MDYNFLRLRQDYYGGEKCLIKKVESLSKFMDEKIKKRKFKSYFVED